LLLLYSPYQSQITAELPVEGITLIDRNKRGLNRYQIGRLLDSYLQAYLNNLATK